MLSSSSKGALVVPQIVCQGNSLTAGTTGAQTPYPTQLQALQPSCKVWNQGHGGESTTQLIARTPEVSMSAWLPWVCVLWEGANAIYLGDGSGRTAAGVFADVSSWCAKYRALSIPGLKIIVPNLTAMKSLEPWRDVVEGYNDLLAVNWGDIADATLDLAAVFSDYNDADKYLADGVHFTSRGYGLVAAALRPLIEAWL